MFLASPPSKACAMRSPASSEHACPTSGLLCGRLLVALAESVLRPGGWENMCRLMCHCVRHIDVDNKHGRSVKAIHSFLSHILPPAGTQNALGESHKKASTQQAARRTGVLARCRRAHCARFGVAPRGRNRTSRAGELRSAPSGPDDWHRVTGKRALAPGVRVRRARALK